MVGVVDAGSLSRAATPRLVAQPSLSLVAEDSVALKSRIDAHGLDLAVVFEQEATPGQALMPLFRQRLFLVDRKKLPSHARSVPLQHVVTLPLVLASRPNALRSVLDRAFAEAGLQPKVVVETNPLSSMLAAVHSGAGASGPKRLTINTSCAATHGRHWPPPRTMNA